MERYWWELTSHNRGGGGGGGGEEEGDNTQVYAVTTRMTPALRPSATRAILMFR